MHEQRHHQRIRFTSPLAMRVGHAGRQCDARLENLSLGGLMFRTDLALAVGETVGCEFRVFDSAIIDLSAMVASKVGEGLYGVRFEAGPMSQHLIQDAIDDAVARGFVSIVTVHEQDGGRLLRVAGGLTAATRTDFMHALQRVGIGELDLSEVTYIDKEGLSMCAYAVARYGARAERRSPCVARAWQSIAPAGATLT